MKPKDLLKVILCLFILSVYYQWSYSQETVKSEIETTLDAREPASLPRLVLFVGPRKCGSTTLQATLGGLKHVLGQDGFVGQGRFLGKAYTRRSTQRTSFLSSLISPSCHIQTKQARVNGTVFPSCWAKTQSELEEQLGKNLVAVEEIMSSPCTSDLPWGVPR